MMGLSQTDRFKSQRHSLLMFPPGAVTLGETKSGVHRFWFPVNDLSQDLFTLLFVASEQEGEPNKECAFRRKGIQMVRSELQGAV